MSATLWRLLCAGTLVLALTGFARADDTADASTADIAISGTQTAYSIPDTLVQTVPWLQHITDAARAYGVDAHLLQAVMKVESNFDPYVVSRSGAIGLMQIMPLTAMSAMGLHGTPQSLKQQLMDPAINVHAGALYLRSLMDTFSHRLDLALAAYNAGTGNVRKAGNRVPPNGETPKFVKKVTDLYASIKAAAGVPDAASAKESLPALTPPVLVALQ